MAATDYVAPIAEARLQAILRLFHHLANHPKPLVSYRLYMQDVGDLLIEIRRLRLVEEDVEATPHE